MSHTYRILDETHNYRSFCCGKTKEHDTLNRFLSNRAFNHQNDFYGTTLVVSEKNKVIGYITLLADTIEILPSFRSRIFGKNDAPYDTYPALKIGRLAVDENHQDTGIGTYLVKLAIGKAVYSNTTIGVGMRFITVDSKNMSKEWYLKRDFRVYDKRNPDFLFYDLKGWKTNEYLNDNYNLSF